MPSPQPDETSKTMSDAASKTEIETMTGAEMVLRAFVENGVDTVFGYPGGAVLPIYDELHQQEEVEHVLVRHEQGAGHAAEGYARSTGRPGVVLVTSGPGATNMVTPLQDALMDSIPLVCITGQVPTTLIGTDAFQECDTVGITRPCTKHNWLVRSIEELPRVLHEAFHVATTGRPGPVVVDIPKDVQFASGKYLKRPPAETHISYQIKREPRREDVETLVAMLREAERPILYTGGGVVNSGPEASQLLRRLVELTNAPITSTLLGLGAYPGTGENWLGMLGMHGSYEANMAMHGCDLMVNIGARFDDRITGRIDAFSPGSRKVHVDIDPSQINKTVRVDHAVIGDVRAVLEIAVEELEREGLDGNRLGAWWDDIREWRSKDSFGFKDARDAILPQQAVRALHRHTKDRDTYVTTDVGQHQMWTAQHFGFEEPNRWMTSGGLGTMGYGLPAALGVQKAHPEATVLAVVGDASVLMCIQELSTAVQYRLPVKVVILNNQYMGMVRQWQQLLHGNRLSHSYTEALPDFAMLAKAYGAHGIHCERPDQLDAAIEEMLEHDGPVVFDCRVANLANCFPMIPSGKPHNEMLLPEEATDEAVATAIDAKGKSLV